MNRPEKLAEPSMEEILASIRKIIAEEPPGPRSAAPEPKRSQPLEAQTSARAQPIAAPAPAPTPLTEPVQTPIAAAKPEVVKPAPMASAAATEVAAAAPVSAAAAAPIATLQVAPDRSPVSQPAVNRPAIDDDLADLVEDMPAPSAPAGTAAKPAWRFTKLNQRLPGSPPAAEPRPATVAPAAEPTLSAAAPVLKSGPTPVTPANGSNGSNGSSVLGSFIPRRDAAADDERPVKPAATAVRPAAASLDELLGEERRSPSAGMNGAHKAPIVAPSIDPSLAVKPVASAPTVTVLPMAKPVDAHAVDSARPAASPTPEVVAPAPFVPQLNGSTPAVTVSMAAPEPVIAMPPAPVSSAPSAAEAVVAKPVVVPVAVVPAAPAAMAAAESVDATPALATVGAVRTLEDTVAELLRPMLREWLDKNMPRIAERALKIEVAPPASGSKPNS